MATKNEGKKIVKIEKNPAPKAPDKPEANGEQTPAETEVKYTFAYCLKHPIKATKHAFEEHPVASGVASLGILGLIAAGVKAIGGAINGNTEDSVEEDDVLDDPFAEDEEENDEEI